MSESAQHLQLVNLLISKVKKMVPKDHWCIICSDSFGAVCLPPQTEEGYRPDVYYYFEELLIIGEAKTSDDVERIHSRAQYEAYIKKCSIFKGMAWFFVAVPWTERATAFNILQKLRKKYPGNYKICVYEGIGGSI
jgi:hypothetical protein